MTSYERRRIAYLARMFLIGRSEVTQRAVAAQWWYVRRDCGNRPEIKAFWLSCIGVSESK